MYNLYMRKRKMRVTNRKQITYVPIDKVTRWQCCQNIAKFLYWSDAEDVEISNLMKILTNEFNRAKVVEKLKTINYE